MGTMIAEMYDALRDAGASEEKARAAATAVADYDVRISRIEADVQLLKWMVGFNIALGLAMFGMLLRLTVS